MQPQRSFNHPSIIHPLYWIARLEWFGSSFWTQSFGTPSIHSKMLATTESLKNLLFIFGKFCNFVRVGMRHKYLEGWQVTVTSDRKRPKTLSANVWQERMDWLSGAAPIGPAGRSLTSAAGETRFYNPPANGGQAERGEGAPWGKTKHGTGSTGSIGKASQTNKPYQAPDYIPNPPFLSLFRTCAINNMT